MTTVSDPVPGAGTTVRMAASQDRNRWFGLGHSTAADVAVAGAEATAAAVGDREAKLLIVFSSMDQDFPGLLEAVRTGVSPDTAIVGCSTCGEVISPAAATGSVVVIALGGTGFEARAAVSRDAAGRQREAGVEVACGAGHTSRPNQVLVLLPDGLIGRHHEVVRGAYSVVGASIPMVGACAGDVTYAKSYQFFGDGSGVEVLTGGVVGVMIGSDAPIGVGRAHGWHASGEPMNLTSSDDNRIHQIDHEPALDVYFRRVNGDYSIVSDPAAFFTFTHAHPLGLARRSGEDIRVIQSVDLADHSLTCFADVQQGALAWLMETNPEDLINGGAESCRAALAALGDAPPIGVIAFDCAVRKIQLGPAGVRQEVAGMEAVVGATPFGGFYSMGEIARTRGARGMHHMTSVSLALA